MDNTLVHVTAQVNKRGVEALALLLNCIDLARNQPYPIHQSLPKALEFGCI